MAKKTAMDCVKLARDPKRPHLFDFIKHLCSDFEELHGDRLVNDDRGLIGGFGTIGREKVLILGHNKGATVEENMEANFGMANPDGYRKAMRLAKLAEKFHLPIVTFVDTPGAYPGREAEERGQAEAIAKSLEFFSGDFAIASACPRSSASRPGYAPGVSTKVTIGLWKRSASFARRIALR